MSKVAKNVIGKEFEVIFSNSALEEEVREKVSLTAESRSAVMLVARNYAKEHGWRYILSVRQKHKQK